jgi:hypothetical protein
MVDVLVADEGEAISAVTFAEGESFCCSALVVSMGVVFTSLISCEGEIISPSASV